MHILSLFRNKFVVLSICLIINLVSHFRFFHTPPRNVHVWRQCNTLAVARNFYHEDMNILKPRVDRRLDTEGVTGMQFPSYEYLVALAYHAFGEYAWVHHLISLIITSLGIIGMYLLANYLLASALAAGIAAWSYTFSPELFYFGFLALPDILALAASVWGLYLFIKWFEKGKNTDWVLSLCCITLAGLTKIQFLAVGFFIAVYVWMYFKRYTPEHTLKKFFQLLAFTLVSVGFTLSWYIYSVRMIEESGLSDFGIRFNPVKDWESGMNTLTKNLISDLPELLMNYGSFALLLIGVFIFLKKNAWKSKWFLPMLAWTLALLAYHIIELGQMDVHTYYMMPYLPVLFLASAYGAKQLESRRIYRILLIVLLLEQPIHAYARIVPARWNNNDTRVPPELYQEESRKELMQSSKPGELSIVGPDISGCIYFYFLEKKGFGFADKSDLLDRINDKTLIESYIERGAKNLYTNDSTVWKDAAINKYLSDTYTQVGNFRVYILKK